MKRKANKQPTFSPADLEAIVLDTCDHVARLMLSVHSMRLLLEHRGVFSHAEFDAVEKSFLKDYDALFEKNAAQLSQELQLAKLRKILAKHKGTIQ